MVKILTVQLNSEQQAEVRRRLVGMMQHRTSSDGNEPASKDQQRTS
ncbi:hypothetical protein MOV08_33030 [Streptomyces yunnanensis]|uniref:Uncharacterized protein n=1 Tax=Streptomyces yunnanensis TaxID=156453 RepID=A0ABY8AF47_9ACTN|nr:hypothetical protein [Streptomyces yunnanensis]WEB43630.1 hypothetical protein MOV08_33030 [Streptomyces yunnanensis]